MSAPAVLVFAALINSFASVCDASAFLRPHPAGESEETTRARVLQGLLTELTSGADVIPLEELEEELRPMYAALPRGPHGELEPATVRYALHRYFAQKYGWHMKGLEPGSRETNETAPAILDIFGEHSQHRGTSLNRLALLASKLAHLVQKEAGRNLEHIYAALKLSSTTAIKRKDAEFAFKWFLVMYLLGDSMEGIRREDLVSAEKDIIDMYPAWRSVKMWSKDLDQTLAFTQKSRRNPFIGDEVSFQQSTHMVQELGRHFGSFQKMECGSLKGALMEMELGGSGRVPLADFYQVGLQEDWQFNENVDYLRSLGALDESDPQRPSIFIPNYLHSQTNCLSTSGFYSVCCTNECEGLLGHLEHTLAAPSALPGRLATLVADLESSTVAAPRNLSSVQLARLEAIAGLHGGQVPLHGRLFAQWLHHAYPRECPYPHLAGSTSALSQEEWHWSTGGDGPLATKEEMARLASESGAGDHAPAAPAPLPWIDVEELVADEAPLQRTRWSSSPTLRATAGLALLASAVGPLLRTALHGPTGGSSQLKVEKYLV